MATEILMPRQGQSVESCLILEWKKNEGDDVQKGDVLCEVETDKAVFTVEAPTSGVLLKILYPQGVDVPVLTPIAYLGQKGEVLALKEEKKESIESVSDKVRISPRARRLARSEGIDPEAIRGTGPKGRILERDVRAALQEQKTVHPKKEPVESLRSIAEEAAALSVSSPGTRSDQGEEVIVAGTRKVIAQRMMESLQSHAQLTLHTSADARTILALRKRFKDSPDGYGYNNITINDMVLFAVARSLLQFPALNAYWQKDRIYRFHEVHLAFAVDTPKGLLVPVIQNAQSLSLKELSSETKRLGQACIEGKIAPEELKGGTFTVSNLGNLGIHSFTPILNSPQVAILGVCSIQPTPVLEGEEVKFIPNIGLSLTIDHQAVDGAPAARFLQYLTDVIAHLDLFLAG
ncbi:MAG: 2-oxo acid dehydrogenase subunit E2 [Spirochaetales bacterium]|nr:2-oxo acid dehydrogenase subunit E2 [Spirochaetales bacterium]